MPRLDIVSRNIAIGRLEAGESQYVVAQHYNVHKSTISRLWQRYLQTGTSNDRPRTGRPRITTAQQDRYIRILHLRNRTVTATQTASSIPGLRRISAQTVRNRLRKLDCEPDDLISVLSGRQFRRARVGWGTTVRNWTLRNWRRIWFSDESRFMLQHQDGRVRLYRRKKLTFCKKLCG